MTTTDNIKAAIDAGMAIAPPRPLDPTQRFYAVTVPDGGENVVIDLEAHLENYRDRPRRKTGTVTATDALSFADYVKKHGLPQTEIWADAPTSALVAVINAHEGGTDANIDGWAGWGDHRVRLGLKPTTAWKAWVENDRKLLSQVEFGEHLEDRLIDIVEPDGATMLELAQTFNAQRSVHFESSKRLKSGETQLVYKEDETTTAGRKGDIAIPDRFTLALRPYEGCDPYKVTARLRYRISSEGALRLGYLLDRPEDTQRSAFDDIANLIHTELTQPIWNGLPQ